MSRQRWLLIGGAVLLVVYPFVPFVDLLLGAAGVAPIGLERQLVNVFIFGMVALKAPVLAGAGTTALPPATVVPVDIIRRFLDAQYVTPATGRAGLDVAKASVVRVICVRR